MAGACCSGSSHADHGKCEDGKEAASKYSVAELVDMTRALSEGDFDWQFRQHFEGEMGALAGHIEILRQRLKGVSSVADSSSYIMPQAAMGVAEISQQAEMGVNSILGLVEGMLSDQEKVLEIVQHAPQGSGKAADLAEVQAIAERSKQGLMALMGQLSFQDVIRQRAEGVQEMIEAVEKKIVELLIKFKVGMSGETLKQVDARDLVREEVNSLSDDIGLDQALVDELLEKIK